MTDTAFQNIDYIEIDGERYCLDEYDVDVDREYVDHVSTSQRVPVRTKREKTTVRFTGEIVEVNDD